jgi:hypothetical protein
MRLIVFALAVSLAIAPGAAADDVADAWDALAPRR